MAKPFLFVLCAADLCFIQSDHGVLITYNLSAGLVSASFANEKDETIYITNIENAQNLLMAWWRRHMETRSVLLTPYEGNSPVIGAFSSQMTCNAGFDVFFFMLA